jgi:membrane-associated phospholipid phosphatase
MKESIFNALLVISKQTPFTTPLLFFMLFMMSLDTRYLILFVMVFFNMFSNYLLKVVIRSGYRLTGRDSLPILGRGYRPKKHSNCSVLGGNTKAGNTFGMPSGHSQIIWSIISYTLIYLYYENKDNKHFMIYYPFQVIFLLLIGLLISYSRVYINCHTSRQVIYGGLIGIGVGIGGYYVYPHPPVLND